MYFIISIDTEEDNWDNFLVQPTLNNIKRIDLIQKLFDRLHIKPTYLITHSVANDQESVIYLKSILESDRCEIGTHLHPWNTPPLEEELIPSNTMLSNLSEELQFKKLYRLHHKIKDSFNYIPQSFRAGRYGLNSSLVKNLIKFNYMVESSITPFLDWRSFHGPDYSNFGLLNPYWISDQDLSTENKDSKLLEVPLSAGFLQKNFFRANNLFNKFKYFPYKNFRIIGFLAQLHLLNKVRLTPEGYSFWEMRQLVKVMQGNGIKTFNLSFHSNSLLPGRTPFVRSERELVQFLIKLETIIQYFLELNFVPVTLSQIPEKLKHII
jgi:hypothetical protein